MCDVNKPEEQLWERLRVQLQHTAGNQPSSSHRTDACLIQTHRPNLTHCQPQ